MHCVINCTFGHEAHKILQECLHSSVGRESDCESKGCGFESRCGQDFFFAIGLNGPLGKNSNRIVRLCVCLSVRMQNRPAYNQNELFKVWLMIKEHNLDCKFIYGFLTLHWHHMSLEMGQGQNVGLIDFCHILILLPLGASVFHKHVLF